MQVALIPASPFSRAFDTDLSRFVLFDKVQGKMPYDAQVGGSMPDSYPALVLAKGYIETPMQTVFDTPVTSGCLSEDPSITAQTGNVYSLRKRRLISPPYFTGQNAFSLLGSWGQSGLPHRVMTQAKELADEAYPFHGRRH
jgi:hypothetical protein